MKLKFLTIVAVMMIAVTANGIGVDDLARIQTEKLASALKLNEKQSAQVQEIIRAQILKLQVAEDMSRENWREIVDEIRSIETDTRESIEKTLDNEQANLLAEIRGPVLPKARMLSLNEHLDLTELQYVTIDSILNSSREQMDPRSGNRREMRKRMQKMNDGIIAVLTDEQREKYEELMEARRDEMREEFRSGGRRGGGRRW